MSSLFQIGVDGGGTKTECVLLDAASGAVVARHLAAGCNPSVVGPDQARLVITDALCAVLTQALEEDPEARIAATLLCMAGNRAFWAEFAGTLEEFGTVTTADDSLPVLELATGGRPGLVLHAGTGSFVAARGPDGVVHYAGGLGWRFGDAGSGYDLGQRTIARALLEAQGWTPPSRLLAIVRDHAQLGPEAEATALTRYFYQHPEPNRVIAGLAPLVLRLATEGDVTANALVLESTGELVLLATRVAAKLFPDQPLDLIPAGLSGPILTQPLVIAALATKTPLPLRAIAEPPIEGVIRLLRRPG